ncbi:MAG: ABC transporter substrate-binding protein [Propionicimonas sp.]
MKRSWMKAGATVVALLLLSTACSADPGGGGSTAPTDAPPATGGDINIAWPSQPPTLDPVVVTTSATNTIAYNVFEGLVALDANLEVQPVLAESWSANQDYSAFTFKLRQGVAFHDGSTVEVDDVKASIERWIKSTSAGQQFFAEAKVTTEGTDTVVITLPGTLYTGIYYLAQPLQQLVIMPAEVNALAVEQTGVPTESLVGTGPFKVESMTVDQQIVLARFDGYTPRSDTGTGLAGAKQAKADKLIFHIVTDATTRINGLVSGQYDFASDIPADNAAELKANPDIKLNPLNSGILAAVFDKAEGPFANQKLRQAAQIAVNAEDVLVSSYQSEEFFDLNGALAAPTQTDWYTQAGLENYNQNNLDKAKQLVAESGYKGEAIKFVTTRDYPYMYNSAVVLVDLFEQIGLKVELEVSDWGTVLNKIADPASFDVFVSDFLKRPVPIAYTYLTPTYAGTTDDPGITAAINQVNAATSQAEGLAGMEALQKAHYSYVPALKFGDIRAITAQRTSVDGFIPFIGPVFYGTYRV